MANQEEQPSGQLTVKPFQRKEYDKRQKHAVKAERLLNESTYNNVFFKIVKSLKKGELCL